MVRFSILVASRAVTESRATLVGVRDPSGAAMLMAIESTDASSTHGLAMRRLASIVGAGATDTTGVTDATASDGMSAANAIASRDSTPVLRMHPPWGLVD